MKKSTTIQFRLTQESKQVKTIALNEYTFEGDASLDIQKLSQSIANVVFRKLKKQADTGVNFGVKISKPFNLVVVKNDEQIFDLASIYNKYTDNAKLKVNAKALKEDYAKAIEMFKTSINTVINEAIEAAEDMKDCVVISEK